MADFIAYMITSRRAPFPYMQYGSGVFSIEHIHYAVDFFPFLPNYITTIEDI